MAQEHDLVAQIGAAKVGHTRLQDWCVGDRIRWDLGGFAIDSFL
jgi:hypothetical protein